MELKEKIRVILDYPHEGIRFKDITTLLRDGQAFHYAISQMAKPYRQAGIDIIVGPEARGFLIGAPLAYELQVGFVPVRKGGKLPGQVEQVEYTLEYGKDSLELHIDAIEPGQKVLVVDDLLATGGTIFSTIELIKRLGGEIVGIAFLIELTYLKGRENLSDYLVTSLIKY